MSRQTSYLFGRDKRVVDIGTYHPSCSMQHSVLSFRKTIKDGRKEVRPYMMDLGSTNGTFINTERIESQRYTELLEQDNIKFGNSRYEAPQFFCVWESIVHQ